MFALTHMYAAQKIKPEADSLFLYGSVFPDIGVTRIIGWDKMAEGTIEFSEFLKHNNKNLKSFANGLLVHEQPYGIDRFVHGEKLDGYAYVKGKLIVDEVSKLFPDQKGLDLQISCHNIIEFSVEYRMLQKYPELFNKMKQILIAIRKNEEELSGSFSKFFDIELEISLAGIKKYNDFLIYDILTREKAINFFKKLTKIQRNVDLTSSQISNILDLAIEKTNDYEEFLEGIILICKKDYISH